MGPLLLSHAKLAGVRIGEATGLRCPLPLAPAPDPGAEVEAAVAVCAGAVPALPSEEWFELADEGKLGYPAPLPFPFPPFRPTAPFPRPDVLDAALDGNAEGEGPLSKYRERGDRAVNGAAVGESDVESEVRRSMGACGMGMGAECVGYVGEVAEVGWDMPASATVWAIPPKSELLMPC